MKKEYLDTAFGRLIASYAHVTGGELTDDEIEMALRAHARKWGGCVACRYSIAHHSAGEGPLQKCNPWLVRSCQLGLSQNDCGCFKPFPEESK